jgi:hypothetical protein
MAKVINELSLLPNLGLGGTTGTTGTMSTMGTGSSINKPGSQQQKVLKTTTALTKQINDLTNKIMAAKQKAVTASGPEQKALVNTVGLLQQQLQQIMAPEQEESEETLKQKIAKGYKLAGQKTGEAIASAAKVPFLSKQLGKMGKYTTGQMSKFIGLESKNNSNKDINNCTSTMKKQKAEIAEEGIIKKGIGGAAGGMLGKAGGAALGAAVGGPIGGTIGGIAGSVLGTGVGAEAMDDDEENSEKLTPAQEEAVNVLSKRKYWVNKVSYQFADQEGGPTVFMMKKPNHYTTHYAEIDPEGLVNGESLKEFLGGREENEEKLTPKQQRIARLAGDKTKIDAADFAKLRAMKEATEHCKAAKKGCKCSKCKECKANQPKKESTDTIDFLKAISQKNYAQADKYLGSIVNEKIKKVINKAIQASK